MRRLAIVLGGLAAVLAPVVGSFGTPAAAAADDPATLAAPVDVVEISGFLDRITLDQLTRSIERAETGGAQALIVQLNSKGAVVPTAEITELVTRMQSAKVPVAVWVGPSGAHAQGAAGQLLGAAAVTGMAPGTRVGSFGAPLPGVTLQLGEKPEELRSRTVNAVDARVRGVVRNPLSDETVPTLRNMLLALNGLSWQGRTLQTTQQVTAEDGTVRVELVAAPRLFKIGLVAQLMHSVASVPVAYLLITIGLCLLLFEFFTAGIGVAGAVGAACTVLGCYGLSALPTRGWAVALLVVAVVAFAIDVQTGVPRFWSGAGMVLFTAGSLFLYRGVHLSWLSLLVGIAGVALTFFSGMPSMVRTRFATPTIGREWMIGAPGEAVTAVDPEGIVLVGEAQWRARTNRATPVLVGGRVKVVAIDGVTLEVEPEEGGARDYRERRGADAPTTKSEETRA